MSPPVSVEPLEQPVQCVQALNSTVRAVPGAPEAVTAEPPFSISGSNERRGPSARASKRSKWSAISGPVTSRCEVVPAWVEPA